MGGRHVHHPVGVRIGIVAEAAGQARPGFLQLVAWIVIGALVVGEGFPVVGGHSIHTEEGQEGEQIKAHGKGPFLSLFGTPASAAGLRVHENPRRPGYLS